MKKFLSFFISSILWVSISSAAYGQENDQKSQIQQFVNESINEYQIPGASLAIVKEGKVVFQENWGVQSDGKRITNNTLFTIGSISKPITSLAIMKLVQEGKINLDESIYSYLHSFNYEKENFENEITVRHLLSHTSGISSKDGLEVADLTLREKDSIKKATEILNGVVLNHEPGSIHQYSAANYLLLGRIIEEVSGFQFPEYIRKEITSKLGMDHTVADYRQAIKLGYTPGYQAWFGKPIKSVNHFDNSGVPYGYIASTSSDMIKFIKFLLGNQKLLDQKNFKEYTSPQVHRKEEFYYGLGWRISTSRQDSYLFHGGETPDSRAELFIHPSKQYGFILLTNKNNISDVMHTTYIREGIRNIIERNRVSHIIPADYKLQWITLLTIIIFTFFSFWLVFHLRKHKLITFVNRILGSIYLVLALTIIPILELIVDSPCRTISLYGSDIAILIKCFIAICVVFSIVLFLQDKIIKFVKKV
ncbi:serine hydrolase domain-containing protein [Fictibacillus phosphorivorans]|uniref:serine hydrolase domain-containing protein n=1 Tax=Fictibacillus phosphorivorans TaxID=1221500 RepID=UPI00203B8EEE|nr:serine hydrolase domain-containing protein [Fictibacillus phosphorivorans]MCM3718837.1 beta-lactamase family protein [Fictibacillus phosphorivorans]MCM3776459.1 beta-lactamase family protein [Fictibacillus phosphorivorans]